MIRWAILDAIREARLCGEGKSERGPITEWLRNIDRQIMASDIIDIDGDATDRIESMASTVKLEEICSGMYPPLPRAWIDFDVGKAMEGRYDRIGILSCHDEGSDTREFRLIAFASRSGEIALPVYEVVGQAVSGSYSLRSIHHIDSFIDDTSHGDEEAAAAVREEQKQVTEIALGLLAGLSWALAKKEKGYLAKRPGTPRGDLDTVEDPKILEAIQYVLSDVGVKSFPREYPAYDIQEQDQVRARHRVRAHPVTSCNGKQFMRKSHERGRGPMVSKRREVRA